jgi:hypothetical protein
MVLTSTGTGTSWVATSSLGIASGIALTDLSSTATGLNYNNTTGVFSFTSGYTLGYASSTSHSTAFGINAGYKLYSDATATYNTAVGESALVGNSLTGDRNNSIGAQSLYTLSTGSQNQAMGVGALYSLTDGWNNVGVGDGAGYNSTSADANVYLGYQAGYGAAGQSQDNNVGIGYRSLYKVSGSSGGSNVAMGFQSGYGISSGAYNIVLGAYSTTESITTGSNNILIGQDVQKGLTATASNQLNIGNLLFSSGLGSGTTLATGKLGIGTSTASAKLFVQGTAGSDDIFGLASSTGSRLLTVTSAGNLGIGSSAPAERLVVQDDANDLLARFQNGTAGTTVKGIRINSKDASTTTFVDLAVDATNNAFGIGIGSSSGALPVGQSDLTRAKLVITAAGNVGIGTATPNSAALLHLNGVNAGIRFTDTTSPGDEYSVLNNSGFKIYNNTDDRTDFTISDVGNFGFGTSPSGNYKFEVTTGLVSSGGRGAKLPGNLMIGSSGGNYGSIGYNIRFTDTSDSYKYEIGDKANMIRFGESSVGVRVYTTGTTGSAGGTISFTAGPYVADNGTSWTSASDARLKDNVETLSVLDRLADYRAVEFDWKKSGTHDVGVIAQELYKIFPEAVFVGNDPDSPLGNNEEGAWGVQYDKLSAVALEGVKELNLKVEDLATTTLYKDLDDESFTKKFFDSLIAWFGDTANGITEFFAGTIHADEMLCVGETCVDEETLKALLQNAGQQGTHYGPKGAGEVASPEPTPEPPVEEPADTATSTDDGTATSTDSGTETTDPAPTPSEDPAPTVEETAPTPTETETPADTGADATTDTSTDTSSSDTTSSESGDTSSSDTSAGDTSSDAGSESAPVTSPSV